MDPHSINSEEDRGGHSLYAALLVECQVGKPWVTVSWELCNLTPGERGAWSNCIKTDHDSDRGRKRTL